MDTPALIQPPYTHVAAALQPDTEIQEPIAGHTFATAAANDTKTGNRLAGNQTAPASVATTGLVLERSVASSTTVAEQIKMVLNRFAQGHGIATDHGVKIIQEYGNVYLGVHTKDLHSDPSHPVYTSLRQLLFFHTGVTGSSMIQVVGDSSLFSQEGTQHVRAFMAQFLEGDHLIEYGYTGYNKSTVDGTMDTNSFVTEFYEQNAGQEHRIVANVLGHTVFALETWGCAASHAVKCVVVVYNDQPLEKIDQNGKLVYKDGFTKFGDDVPASDFIMSAAYGDKLILVEGGAQSFKQAANALERDIPIEALYGIGIRKPDDRKFFSTAEFFNFLTINSKDCNTANLTEETARELFEAYLKDHTAWNPARPDAETKEKLFRASAEDFFKNRLYLKITSLVTLHIRE